jgi:hypothetical protein
MRAALWHRSRRVHCGSVRVAALSTALKGGGPTGALEGQAGVTSQAAAPRHLCGGLGCCARLEALGGVQVCGRDSLPTPAAAQGMDAAVVGETKSTRVVLRETLQLMKSKSV